MSKQIAQTVGDKRIAVLFAIIAAFAVIATLATQWQKSEAAGNDCFEACAVVDNEPSAAAIPSDHDRYDFVAIMSLNQPGVISSDSPAVIDSTDILPANPWDQRVARNDSFKITPDAFEVRTAAFNFTDRVANGRVVFSALAPPGHCVAVSCEMKDSKNVPIGSSNGPNYTEGMLRPAKQPGDTRPSQSHSESKADTTGSDTTAIWLYAALGLGALAFGVGGTAVARRSR